MAEQRERSGNSPRSRRDGPSRKYTVEIWHRACNAFRTCESQTRVINQRIFRSSRLTRIAPRRFACSFNSGNNRYLYRGLFKFDRRISSAIRKLLSPTAFISCGISIPNLGTSIHSRRHDELQLSRSECSNALRAARSETMASQFIFITFPWEWTIDWLSRLFLTA